MIWSLRDTVMSVDSWCLSREKGDFCWLMTERKEESGLKAVDRRSIW